VAKKQMQSLVDLSPSELKSHEAELREELFSLRFRNKMRQLDNGLKIRAVRRQIARAQTLLAQHDKVAAKEKTR